MNNRQHVFSAILAIALLAQAPAVQAARVSIAAVVGDDIITTTDVTERRDLIMAMNKIAPTVENQQQVTPRVIQSLVDEALQMQEAKRQSITVSDAELAKTIESMGTRDGGLSIRDYIERGGLSKHSFENQLRAQIAWGKVVQRKLRRNVNISQDEVERAQKSAAAAPGEPELRIQALELRIPSADKVALTDKLVEQVMIDLKAGADMASIASKLLANPNARFSQPNWVAESKLPPPLQQLLRSIKPGEYTQPLRGGNSIQILQLLDRKTTPKLSDATEYALKLISIPVPAKRDKASLAKLTAVAASLRADPGDCLSETVPQVGLPAQASFVRTRLDGMTPEQRAVVTHLEVGDISEPLPSPDALRLAMVCEKIEPSLGALPDAEKVRQQLFAEKMELEAEKHLRNLRRDAYIDIKGDAK